MRISANHIQMNYEWKGEGEDFVLIHGAGDTLSMWSRQVPAFAKSYRVITYDVRGAGKSDSPKTEYSMSLFADDLFEFVKAVKAQDAQVVVDAAGLARAASIAQSGGSHYFLGYSMGGRIALELAIKHPGMVKVLILANSSVGLTAPSPEAAERRRVALELLDKGDIKKFAEMMTTNAFSPNFRSKNPKEFENYMKVKLQNKPDGLARIMRAMAVPSSPPDLSKVKCPVLIIVGENDPNLGVEQGKQAQKAIAGSKLVILPTGHAAAIELPDRFNSAVLEFLSEVRSK